MENLGGDQHNTIVHKNVLKFYGKAFTTVFSIIWYYEKKIIFKPITVKFVIVIFVNLCFLLVEMREEKIERREI